MDRMSNSFVHLHNHSHFSMLDGASHIKAMVQRAKTLGMPGLGLTDHGNLHGSLQFYRECRNAGIVPVLGYEAYLCVDCKHTEKTRTELYHLTVLAKNRTGWDNLRRLASIASCQGFYYKPRVDRELLEHHREGLIILSGCIASEVSSVALTSPEKTVDLVEWYERTFGDDFYIELMRNGSSIQDLAYNRLCDVARNKGIPPVATADCHYVLPTDDDLQDTMVCINLGLPRAAAKQAPRMMEKGYHLRSPEEMRDQFPITACDNTLGILEQIDLEIETGVRHFPVAGLANPHTKLYSMCRDGMSDRLGLKADTTDWYLYSARLDRELEVIHNLGFDDYFLIVADFCRFARDNGIFASARGSGVGSLVSYCLYISHVDPIKEHLLFERFLDPSRREAPDIDIDIEKDRRAEVLAYVKAKYGEDRVAQIGTFNTLGAKSSLKDVAKAMSVGLGNLLDHIPDLPGTTLEDVEEGDAIQGILDARLRPVWEMAKRIEGMARSFGTHAAGVVIGDRPLVDYVPLCMGKDGQVVTQWDMNDCESIGLLKMDFLGLRNLTILQECLDAIEDSTGKRIDIHKIPMDDQEVFAMLSAGGTKGVFQLESSGMTGLLVQLQPTTVEHICACIALYRPGPLDCGMVDAYVKRKTGAEAPLWLHPAMKEILGSTYGVMVYQEQVMMVLHRVGNIPLSESYSCIKAIGKKIREKVEAYKGVFVKGCAENGVDGEYLWSQIVTFARYGFNRSHSMAYAYLAYQTAWLKCHFPRQYMAAVLNTDIDQRSFNKRDDLLAHLDDVKAMGIPVWPPHVNHSMAKFSVQPEGQIVWGLAALKGVSWEMARSIEKEAPYTSLFDFCKRAQVPRQCVVNLIAAGAFDVDGMDWVDTRSVLTATVDRAIKVARQEYKQLDKYDGVFVEADTQHRGIWLAREREIAGCYLSGHPLDNHALLRRLGPPEWLPADANTGFAGLIHSVEIRHTRNNREFATFWVEGPGANCECITWEPKILEGHINHQRLVLGRANRRGSHCTLSVNKIVAVGEWTECTGICVHARDEQDAKAIARYADMIGPGSIDLLIAVGSNIVGKKYGWPAGVQTPPGWRVSLVQDYRFTPPMLRLYDHRT